MRLGELDQLIGETIVSYRDGAFTCLSGRCFELIIEDEGPDNDSHVFVAGSDFMPVYDKPITVAYPTNESQDGVNLMFETADGRFGFIAIQHNSNGCYWFSWSLREVKP